MTRSSKTGEATFHYIGRKIGDPTYNMLIYPRLREWYSEAEIPKDCVAQYTMLNEVYTVGIEGSHYKTAIKGTILLK